MSMWVNGEIVTEDFLPCYNVKVLVWKAWHFPLFSRSYWEDDNY